MSDEAVDFKPLSGTMSYSLSRIGTLTLKLTNCSLDTEIWLTINETNNLREVLNAAKARGEVNETRCITQDRRNQD